jgi:hypothetical protein
VVNKREERQGSQGDSGDENGAPCPLFRIFPNAPSSFIDHKASSHLELEPVNREIRPFDRFQSAIALIRSSVNRVLGMVPPRRRCANGDHGRMELQIHLPFAKMGRSG